MEFRQIKTFRAVADNLSFTKAAVQLFMAQSSVSAQIKTLEEELEIKLFDRIGRSVLLTDAGIKLYDYARRMEDMTLEIRSEISNSKYSRGNLTIRVPETLAAVYMPAIVDRFHAQHPKVKLTFINCTDRQLKEELNSGRIDLAFLMTDSIHFNDVTVRMLKTEKLHLAASPLHPLAIKKNIRLKDLDGQTVLLPKTD
jgi:DNA-binding transcriptional LysR family regulator